MAVVMYLICFCRCLWVAGIFRVWQRSLLHSTQTSAPIAGPGDGRTHCGYSLQGTGRPLEVLQSDMPWDSLWGILSFLKHKSQSCFTYFVSSGSWGGVLGFKCCSFNFNKTTFSVAQQPKWIQMLRRPAQLHCLHRPRTSPASTFPLKSVINLHFKHLLVSILVILL